MRKGIITTDKDGNDHEYEVVRFYECNQKKKCNKSPACGKGCTKTIDKKYAVNDKIYQEMLREVIKN